jgi:hypothetical protein
MAEIRNELKWSSTSPKWSSTFPCSSSQCRDLSSVTLGVIALSYNYDIITNSRYIGKYNIKISGDFINFQYLNHVPLKPVQWNVLITKSKETDIFLHCIHFPLTQAIEIWILRNLILLRYKIYFFLFPLPVAWNSSLRPIETQRYI